MAEEADGRVPGPGDDVSADVEGVAVGEDGQIVVGRHEGEGRDDGLPAAASCPKEEQASTDGGEAYAGGGEKVGQDTAENGEEKYEISSHGRPQNLYERPCFTIVWLCGGGVKVYGKYDEIRSTVANSVDYRSMTKLRG